VVSLDAHQRSAVSAFKKCAFLECGVPGRAVAMGVDLLSVTSGTGAGPHPFQGGSASLGDARCLRPQGRGVASVLRQCLPAGGTLVDWQPHGGAPRPACSVRFSALKVCGLAASPEGI